MLMPTLALPSGAPSCMPGSMCAGRCITASKG